MFSAVRTHVCGVALPTAVKSCLYNKFEPMAAQLGDQSRIQQLTTRFHSTD